MAEEAGSSSRVAAAAAGAEEGQEGQAAVVAVEAGQGQEAAQARTQGMMALNRCHQAQGKDQQQQQQRRSSPLAQGRAAPHTRGRRCRWARVRAVEGCSC
jgi:choline dehydrogenase-like flavoprotein